MRKIILAAAAALIFNSCKDDDRIIGSGTAEGTDRYVVVSNITTANPVTAYVGTFSDLNISDYNNSRARQTTQYPYITVYGNSVFVIPNKGGDILRKYDRGSGGALTEAGSIALPAASTGINIVVESPEKAYCSLINDGKIMVFNPKTMQQTGMIDLTAFAIGDGSPDPAVMLLRNGKLYVACAQTSDGFTSPNPAQVLIVDTKTLVVKSITDSRTYMASNFDEKNSMFMDEKGDIYLFCTASYGFADPSQKCGFLRIKNGEEQFDPTYFFNVKDFNISGIPEGHIDYLEHMKYAGNGILFATGNIFALGSNPPDYVNDRTFGSFSLDLSAQTISRLPLPYSNGYSASVAVDGNRVLWGLSTNSGTGIYFYDRITGQAQEKPNIRTQGDISYIDSF